MSGKRPIDDPNQPEASKRHKNDQLSKIEEVKARIAARKALLDKQKQPESAQAATQSDTVKILQNVPRAEFATSKANIRAAQKTQQKSLVMEEKAKVNPYFDPKLAGRNERKIKPNIKFIPQGKFVEQAEKLRKDYELDQLKRKIAERARKTGLESEIDAVGENAVPRYDTPFVEWWDSQFYGDDGVLSEELIRENVSALIHHPVIIDPPGADGSMPPIAVMMTSKEKKRARQLRRMEALKEKQEKIRLNLLPPEEPKLTMANVMRVLGDEAVLDPTAVEGIVKKQMQERLERHLKANEERKLTPEERSEKNRRKHEEDKTLRVNVAAFKYDQELRGVNLRVKDFSNPSHRFKVTKNAEQLQLTGICILYENCNVVIVEGGPKGIRKYTNLMLNRIQWNGEGSKEDNQCLMIWEGVVKKQCYRQLRLRECATQEIVKEWLSAEYHNLWELAKSLEFPPISKKTI